jgi:predicted regulator of Ras-like GTPase activity (Roadblock/LC7/MglB family)
MPESVVINERMFLLSMVDSCNKEDERVGDISQKLKTLPDVEYALVISKDDVVAGDSSYEAEVLTAYTRFLAKFGAQMGAHFGAGDLRSASVQGNDHHLFVFESKSQYLGVSAKGSSSVTALESGLRQVLAQK